MTEFGYDDFGINIHGETEELSESISVIRTRDGLYINLSLPDLGHPDKPNLWNEIHGHNTLKGGELVCGKGHPKSVRQYADGSRWAYHLNKGDSLNHGPSPEHEAVADWLYQRAERLGFRVEREYASASGLFRNDVYMEGDGGIRIGGEVQYSPSGQSEYSQRSGLVRSNKMIREGVNPLWVAPSSNANGIRDVLPSAIFQDLPLEVVRADRDIRVIAGPAKCDLIDHAASPQDCPKREGRRCTGVHPRLRSWGLDLNDMLEQVGTGDLVIVRRKARQAGRNVSVLHYIAPRHRDRFLENGGALEALAAPVKVKSPKAVGDQRERGFTLDCSRPVAEPRYVTPASSPAVAAVAPPAARVARGTCAYGGSGCTGGIHLYIYGWRCDGHNGPAWTPHSSLRGAA